MKEKFARWNILLVQYLKRDWKKIIFWILGVGLFSAGLIPTFEEIGKGEGMIGMYETLKNPAMIAIVGPTPVKSAIEYTLGAMYAHEMLLFCGLFAMIIACLHVVSYTRKAEDYGLTELIRSFQVGRQANSLAVLVEVIIINIILALFIGLILSSYKAESITFEGSFIFGASIGIAGIIGAVIALVISQIMPTSSGATGSSLGIIGFLYLLRAFTDISNVDISKINPMGWTYLTFPFTENNWLFIIIALIFSFFMLILVFALEGARDLGQVIYQKKKVVKKQKNHCYQFQVYFLN